jgi:sugar O-acyltransferase (sialic acid O-acetyltransferase NeuD family)
MKYKLLIIGASGHGKVIADIAIRMNRWKEIVFLDDNPTVKTSLGLNVIGNTESIAQYIEDYDIFVAIGNNSIRKQKIEQLKELGATIPILKHPTAIIGKDVQINIGTAIMAGAIINPSTNIGEGCIINTGSTIDHDNIIESYVHISPGAHLAGTVSIGENTWIGIGSIISNNIKISKDCIVGAGGVVVKNITEAGTYIGVPVKRTSKAKV